MIRPLLSLEHLSLDEQEGKVCCRYGEGAEELERMDYLDFIARVTSHIPVGIDRLQHENPLIFFTQPDPLVIKRRPVQRQDLTAWVRS